MEQRTSGRLLIVLSDQHYTESIGWYTQRQIELDHRQWQQLRGHFGPTASEAFDTFAPESDPESVATILPFPGPQEDDCVRSAVGGTEH